MKKLDNYFKYFTQRKQGKGVVGQEVWKGFRRGKGFRRLVILVLAWAGSAGQPLFKGSRLPSKILSLSKGG